MREVKQIQQALLRQHNLRVTDAVAEYVLGHIQHGAVGAVPIIGGDARTGVATRLFVPVNDLATEPQPTQS